MKSGHLIPAGFVPRAEISSKTNTAQFVIDIVTLSHWFHLNCEVFKGTVSKMERHKMPADRIVYAGGAMQTRGYSTIWLEEMGDVMVGYATPYVYHEVKVGHKIRMVVRPDSGLTRKMWNLTKPRPWWVF